MLEPEERKRFDLKMYVWWYSCQNRLLFDDGALPEKTRSIVLLLPIEPSIEFLAIQPIIPRADVVLQPFEVGYPVEEVDWKSGELVAA